MAKEGSKAEEAADRKEAKKAGVSFKKYEAMDKKKDTRSIGERLYGKGK